MKVLSCLDTAGRLARALVVAVILGGAGGTEAVEVRRIDDAAPDDATLARVVEQRISGRPGVDRSRVAAGVEDSVLTLSGNVSTLHERGEIERLVATIRGLRAVENKIEVDRGSDPDPLLEVHALRAIESSPRLRAFGLQIHVLDGALTIEGEVSLARDRADAEDLVSEVSGVVSVQNQIRLAPCPFDPALVKKKIEGLLARRLIFGGVEDLRVTVGEGGEVVLEGVVPTGADRMRAERLVYGVRGVVSIRNLLQVRRFQRSSS